MVIEGPQHIRYQALMLALQYYAENFNDIEVIQTAESFAQFIEVGEVPELVVDTE